MSLLNNKLIPADTPLHQTSPILKKVKEILSQAWGFTKVVHHNPSPNPVSFERKHLKLVQTKVTDYVVAEKSDGVRFQLVLGTINMDESKRNGDDGGNGNGGNNFFSKRKPRRKGFAVLVNRKMEMYEIPICAHADYFTGSVFDGELILEPVLDNIDHMEPSVKQYNEQMRQVFLIFDVISVKGQSKRNLRFMERYHQYLPIFDMEGKCILKCGPMQWDEIATELAREKDKIICLGNKMALEFRAKPFISFINVGSLWRTITTSFQSHKSDGLIIVNAHSTVGTGTDANIMKWKENHTIDLIVHARFSKGNWSYSLFFQDQDCLKDCKERAFSIQTHTETNDEDSGDGDGDGDNDVRMDGLDGLESTTRSYYLTLNIDEMIQTTSKYYGETHKTSYRLLGEFSCTIDENQPIVWCKLDRWRNDKKTPNYVTVIEKTLQTIKDNVTIQSLIKVTSTHLYHLNG